MQDNITDDMVCGWLIFLISSLKTPPERVIVNGGSPGFIKELINQGHSVVYVDNDTDEINRMADSIANMRNLPDHTITYCPIDLEQWSGGDLLELKNNDCIIFCRSLHHMQNPAAAICNVRERLRKGTILIAELTTELQDTIQREHEEEKENAVGFLKHEGANDACEELEREWEKYTALNRQCAAGLERLGFRQESDVRTFLIDTLNHGPFTMDYVLPCPCETACGKRCWYWIAEIICEQFALSNTQ
jgi:SAM-dependent methyltransferase